MKFENTYVSLHLVSYVSLLSHFAYNAYCIFLGDGTLVPRRPGEFLIYVVITILSCDLCKLVCLSPKNKKQHFALKSFLHVYT